MKKLSFFMAMLALALVLGLAFVGCGGGGDDKTIEGLFKELQGSSIYMYANDGAGGTIRWCPDHKRWEGYSNTDYNNHNIDPAFTLAAATQLSGSSMWPSGDTNSLSGTLAKEAIKKLDAFYASSYRISDTPSPWGITNNGIPYPDGTPVVLWYSFQLNRNGTGMYGASATPSTFPLNRYSYNFN